MASRVYALLFLLTLKFSSLATAVPAKRSLEPLTLSTFSEISPIWSDGSLTLSTFVANSGFEAPPTVTPATDSVVSRTTIIGATTTTKYVVTPEASTAAVTSTATSMTTLSLLAWTTSWSTVTQAGGGMTSNTSTVTEVTSGVTSITSTGTIPDTASATTSGAGFYTTSTSTAAAATFVAGLGSLLGVAVGAVVLL